jgi:hypothetical protein
MLTHCVFFWLRATLTDEEQAEFERGLRTLPGISSVVDGSVGEPAATIRPSVERSYSYALVLKFKDMAGHDAYQADAIHNRFHSRFERYWTNAVVYDFVDRGA